MPTLEILAEAAEEAEAAVDWYEREQPDLGRQFHDALNAGSRTTSFLSPTTTRLLSLLLLTIHDALDIGEIVLSANAPQERLPAARLPTNTRDWGLPNAVGVTAPSSLSRYSATGRQAREHARAKFILPYRNAANHVRFALPDISKSC